MYIRQIYLCVQNVEFSKLMVLDIVEHMSWQTFWFDCTHQLQNWSEYNLKFFT